MRRKGDARQRRRCRPRRTFITRPCAFAHSLSLWLAYALTHTCAGARGTRERDCGIEDRGYARMAVVLGGNQ
jgi:hypothetical protein